MVLELGKILFGIRIQLNIKVVFKLWVLSHLVISKSLWHFQIFSLPGSSVQWNFPDKNTGVGCLFRLQGVFLTQGLNSSLLCLLTTVPPREPVMHKKNLPLLQLQPLLPYFFFFFNSVGLGWDLKFAFLTSSHVILVLLIHTSHFESHCRRELSRQVILAHFTQ